MIDNNTLTQIQDLGPDIIRRLTIADEFIKTHHSHIDDISMKDYGKAIVFALHIVNERGSTLHEYASIPGIGHIGKDFTLIFDDRLDGVTITFTIEK